MELFVKYGAPNKKYHVRLRAVANAALTSWISEQGDSSTSPENARSAVGMTRVVYLKEIRRIGIIVLQYLV